ncbi:MAG: lamin tail domain-containing protein, partial [Bacteroidota bacterium]
TTTHTFTGVTMDADGGSISLTAAFSADAACNFSNGNADTAPAACSACGISGISVANISACNNLSTSNPADDTFTADVTVTFANPPATGNLNLTGDPIFSPVSVPVGSLSGTTHTFTGVVFSADGTAIVLNAFFSADAGCTFTNSNAGTAPANCSGTVCTVSGVSVSGISACNDNGTPFGSDDFFTANVTVTFANPPGSGALNLTGDGVATVAVGSLGSSTSHTFTGVMMSADGGSISLSATFSADSGCTFTNGNAGAAPASCSCGLKINEVDYDQVGADNAEFIELYNPCGSAQNLDNYSVELVNGSGGGAAVYKTIDLPNVNLAAGDYFVICANGANTSNCDLDVTPDADLIQNGAPDAIGLKYLTVVVDALSYEGNAGAPYLEGTGTSAFDDNTTPGIGLSRFPNGSDSNDNTADFSIRCITPGAANSASTSGCVAVCNISSVTMGSVSACNSQNTSNPADDTFTADVTVTFANPPATGNLRLTGDPIFSPIEVPVSSLSGNSHTFTGVVFAADGGAVNLIAAFTADAGCTLTNSNAGTAPSACSCNISAVTASNISDCEDQGTSTPTDDRFTADVTVTFANPPASGNLLVTGDPIFSPVTVAVGSLGSSTSHTFNNVLFSADGTAINLNAFFSADATCAASNPNAGMAPAPCSPCEITSVSMANASGCNSNGTPNPADDFFTADVTVTFFSKPGTGNLSLSGSGSASAPVGAIGSFSHTFTGLQMPANGSTVNLTALFSENAACILTNPAAGVAPVSCSPCGITGISVSNISACDDQGTSDPLDDTFTADVTVSFFNPPASGTLDLSGDGSG